MTTPPLLFASAEKANCFDMLLAGRQQRLNKAECIVYENEIKAAIDRCGEILMQYGAKDNFIAKIYDLENQIRAIEKDEADVS